MTCSSKDWFLDATERGSWKLVEAIFLAPFQADNMLSLCLCQIPTHLLLIKISSGVSGACHNCPSSLHFMLWRFLHIAEQGVLPLATVVGFEIACNLQPPHSKLIELNAHDWRGKAPQTCRMQLKFHYQDENFTFL